MESWEKGRGGGGVEKASNWKSVCLVKRVENWFLSSLSVCVCARKGGVRGVYCFRKSVALLFTFNLTLELFRTHNSQFYFEIGLWCYSQSEEDVLALG